MEDRIIASIDEEGKYYPLNNFSFIDEKQDSSIDLEFLLALLNSRLMNFYFKNVYIDYNIKPKYIEQLPIYNFNHQTIFEASKSLIELYKVMNAFNNQFTNLLRSKYHIVKLSNKLSSWYNLEAHEFMLELKKYKVILTLKEEAQWMEYFNKEKDKVRELKVRIDRTYNEIDVMVYKLYNLNYDEAKIVDPEFWLSEDEYKKYNPLS